jgi:hypothetical protein
MMSVPEAAAALPAMGRGRVAEIRWALRGPAVGSIVLVLASCQRQERPVYVPPPPPSAAPELPAAPAAAPSGEQLTIARACATDIERFCAGVPPRQGMIKECMKAHVTELSASCFDAVMSAVAAGHAP